MNRKRFDLKTGGQVVVWPTRYHEVCLFAADDDGEGAYDNQESVEELAAFLSPEEARRIGRELLAAADAADESEVSS